MKKRLLFIGDSITDCDHLWDFHSKALGNGWVRMVSDYMDRISDEYEVINCGFNGFTTTDLLYYWQKNGKALRPDVVTVLIGVNDIAEYFDMGDLMAMAYPKAFVQVSGIEDNIFPVGAAEKVFEAGKAAYAAMGKEEICVLVKGNGGHRFYADDAWPHVHKILGK